MDLAPRWSASSINAKWHLSMEGVPDRGNHCRSRASGRDGLGSSHPGGPTRRRESRSNENRRGRSDGDVRGRPHRSRRLDNIPGSVANLERGVNVARQAEKRVRVCTPSPGQHGGSQNPSFRARRKSRGQCREPTSTGNRSREFGKQTSDERIDGACPARRRKAQRRERCLARRKLVPGKGEILTTRASGETAKTVRRFPAPYQSGLSEEIGLEG
jgi:hypothetical protein